VARHLIEQQRMFPESRANVACDRLDSHYPKLDGYRRMLKAWRPLSDMELLQRADVERIAAERIHPEHRAATAAAV
jgi:uncharacterized protein YfbU (UPF0304 family)